LSTGSARRSTGISLAIVHAGAIAIIVWKPT
jgi:hypothetical protein